MDRHRDKEDSRGTDNKMKTYTTVQGDTFDYIAYKVLGSEKYTSALLKANTDKADILVFSAGIALNIPEIEKESTAAEGLPPWKNRKGGTSE